jgi:hypothetical protein
MSNACNVTATIENLTSYTLTFVNNIVQWGYFNLNGNSVPPNTSNQGFYAYGAEGSATGCQGSATYSFTDAAGHLQEVTFYYSVPWNVETDNEYSATVPGGLTCTNNGPSSGDHTICTYTLSGTVGSTPHHHGLPCAAAAEQ